MPELIPAEPGSPEWLAARRAGVTATDIVTILGLSHHDSPYSLFWRKMGQVPDVERTDRMALGLFLEDYIILRWTNTGDNWHDFVRWPGGLYRHSERAWQMATPDRVLTTASDDGGKFIAVFEGKTWADADRHAWQDAPPPQVRAQVLWQMDVMDVSTGHVGVVFLPSGEFRSYTIEHADTPVWQADGHGGCKKQCMACSDIFLMRQAGEEFMARLRLELPPPDPDSSAATLAAVRARFAKVPAKQAEVDLLTWNAWTGAKLEVDKWTETVRGHEILLREQAGEAGEYTVDGQVVARRVVSDAQVKAHTRHSDYLKRVKQAGTDDE